MGGCKVPRLFPAPRSPSFQAGGGRACPAQGPGGGRGRGEACCGGELRPRTPAERGPRGPDQQVSLLPQRTAAHTPRPLGSRPAGSTVRNHGVRSLFSPTPLLLPKKRSDSPLPLPPRRLGRCCRKRIPCRLAALCPPLPLGQGGRRGSARGAPGHRWSRRGARCWDEGPLWTTESSKGMGQLGGEFASVTKRGRPGSGKPSPSPSQPVFLYSRGCTKGPVLGFQLFL